MTAVMNQSTRLVKQGFALVVQLSIVVDGGPAFSSMYGTASVCLAYAVVLSRLSMFGTPWLVQELVPIHKGIRGPLNWK